MKKVKIFLITFRRPLLLKRSLEGVLNQTFKDWECFVVNDDPTDEKPGKIIQSIKNDKIKLLKPLIKRGPVGSFNEVYKAEGCEYAAILEDDNWWQNNFLEEMLRELDQNKQVYLACSNEKIWMEQTDKTWRDSGKTVWEEGKNEMFISSLNQACGTPKTTGGAVVVRRHGCEKFLIPDDVPMDVNEHFRERVVPMPILLIKKPLLNFAVNLRTFRSRRSFLVLEYNSLLIGSIFMGLDKNKRHLLAKSLLKKGNGLYYPWVTSMLATSIGFPEARELWNLSSPYQKLRFFGSMLKNPLQMWVLTKIKSRRTNHLSFLCNSLYNQNVQSMAIE